MKIIGLTGGIASGKSSVSRCLSAERHVSSDVTEPGLPIVDLDLIARDALMPGTDAFRKVVHAFGSGVVKYGPASGPDTDVPYDQWRIDRKKLGEIVFNDAAARRKLNGIMQKGIALRLAGALLYHFVVGTEVVVVDAPLLFETGLHKICSTVVVVSVDAPTQLRRLMARDGAGEADAAARIAAQPLSLEAKAARAGVVLDNRGAKRELEAAIGRALPSLLRVSPAQRLLSGPALLLASATALALAGRTALPPIDIDAALSAGGGGGRFVAALGAWAALLLVLPAVTLGVDRELLHAGARWWVATALLCVLVPWWVVLPSLVLCAAAPVGMAVLRPVVLAPHAAKHGAGEEELAPGECALFAGSFNPLHEGHLAVLRTMARRHPTAPTLYAAVAYNPSKRYAVTPEERRRLVAEMCEADPLLRGRVRAVVVDGYAWRLAVRLRCARMYRGVRTWRSDGAAESLLQALNVVGPMLLAATLPPPTRFVESPPELTHVSSTLVRRRAERRESLEGLVPAATEERVAALYRTPEERR